MREGLGEEKLRGIYRSVAAFYDLEHGLLTARSDQRGRRLVVEHAVGEGDSVLDCGAGTGSTALLCARKTGESGSVTLFDLSGAMLDVAKEKAAKNGSLARMSFQTGDMTKLPFADATFDSVVSTYSLCPLYDPARGALELIRVVKPGGKVGVAHSAEPRNRAVARVADAIEGVAWRIPWLSMGCRSVSVLPALRDAGARLLYETRLGVPLWPFLVFVVEKPAA